MQAVASIVSGETHAPHVSPVPSNPARCSPGGDGSGAAMRRSMPGPPRVQNEHAPGDWSGVPDAHTQPTMPSRPMSSARLLVCLAALGWPVRELARRTGNHQTTVVRWTQALSPVPDDVAAWLETLVAFFALHPAPRAARGPGQSRSDRCGRSGSSSV